MGEGPAGGVQAAAGRCGVCGRDTQECDWEVFEEGVAGEGEEGVGGWGEGGQVVSGIWMGRWDEMSKMRGHLPPFRRESWVRCLSSPMCLIVLPQSAPSCDSTRNSNT